MSLYGGVYDDLPSTVVNLKGTENNLSSQQSNAENQIKKAVQYKSTLQFMAPKIKRKLTSTNTTILTKKKQVPHNHIKTIINNSTLLQHNVSLSTDVEEPFLTPSTEFSLPPDVEVYDPFRPNNYEDYLLEKEAKLRAARESERLGKERKRQLRRALRQSKVLSSKDNKIFKESTIKAEVKDDAKIAEESFSRPSVLQSDPVKINLNETAEEAIARRRQLSQGGTPSTNVETLNKKGAVQSSAMKSNSLFTPVVLLENMVGPGEVDNDLQPEISEECARYGKVEKCLIFEVPKGQIADDKAVRIFVEFGDVDAAKKAFLALNGRFFDGRKVRASFFNFDKFKNYELAPNVE
ncbi:splicing factor 45-like [Zophobas morio]|jgi:hypothetical protein|uniref:splicing factor 45-like n=1 Tax=Zophobas morio TaxID=2755281 RepID=UPI0030827FF6